MKSKQQILEELRTKKAAAAEKVKIKPKIKALLQKTFNKIKASASATGQDRINELILKQVSDLQELFAEQLTTLSDKFGITGIENGEPVLTIPPPSVSLEEVNSKLPKPPEELNIPNLTLNPVQLKVSELGTLQEVVKKQFEEQLTDYKEEAGTAAAEEAKARAQELAKELTTEYLQSQNPPYCPADLEKVLKQLNSLISVLEDACTILNYTAAGLQIVADVIQGIIDVKQAITIAKVAANQAMKVLPVTPGIIPSAIIDLQDIIANFTFNADGSAKQKDRIEGLRTGAYYTSIASAIVNEVVIVLGVFVDLLNMCGVKADPLGPETERFLSENRTRLSSDTQQSYQGFTFQIIQRPLPSDPKIQRNVAQALNTEGIVALESQPSFTGNPKVLIEELKLIIDRDNLKAY